MEIKNFAHENNWDFIATNELDEHVFTQEFILILLATWSQKDFSLVASLSEIMIQRSQKIFLMDIDDGIDFVKFRKKFEGVPVISQTPVLIYYKGGRLEKFLQGIEIAKFR